MIPDSSGKTPQLRAEASPEQQELEEATTQGREALRHSLVKTTKILYILLMVSLAIAAFIPVSLVIGSAWAFRSGNTSSLSAMGLLWLLCCFCGYLFCMYLAELNSSDWWILERFERFASRWEDRWKLYLDLPLSFNQISLEGRKAVAFAKGMGEELAEWSDRWAN